jgi:tetratricopeptide (TPR) repeat protein
LLPERGAPPAGWLRRGPGAMTRAWCMFELVKALAKGATLHVVLAPADVDGFEELLTRRFDEIAGIVAGIDAADAQITKIEDRDYILAEVAQLEGGIGAVTATVCASLREWLAAEGRAALARMPREERATSALQNQLGMLLMNQGKLDEAGGLLREALEARRVTLGDRHPSTLTWMNNLGLLLQAQGKLNEAGVLFRDALEASRATLGGRHPDTLISMNNLGGLLLAQGKLDEAGVVLREALEAKRATLGERHPSTLASINNLASLLQDRGKLDEAGVLYRECLAARRATLGDRHRDTLESMINLGGLLLAQGKHDEAGVFVHGGHFVPRLRL